MISFLKGVKKGMASFGQNIALLVNSILLTVAYMIGIGITAIIAKLVGKKFLATEKSSKSYWKKLDLKKKDMDSYYRQF